jgi:hypothetical protein
MYMKYGERLANYARSCLVSDLTGPQARRLKHKENRANKHAADTGSKVHGRLKKVVVEGIGKTPREGASPQVVIYDEAARMAKTAEVIKVVFKSGLKRTFKVKEGEDALGLLAKYRAKPTVESAELTEV